MNKLLKKLTLQNLYVELFVFGVIITSALLLRMYKLDTRPGYEWDEPIYAYISENYNHYGFPVVKPEGNTASQPFLYHPPFDFKVKSLWIASTGIHGVFGTRLLSVLFSSLSLWIVYQLFRELTNRKVSMISLLLLATDGWLIYTNRLNLMENIMITIGISSIALYIYATKHPTFLNYAATGVLLGATVIYKHTGLYFLLIPALYLVFTKKNVKHHIALYVASLVLIGTYVAAMYYTWGNIYLQQTLVQVYRALGIYPSRGLNYSVMDALTALLNTYWIYFSTIVVLIIGSLLTAKNTFDFVSKHKHVKDPLLLSWSLSSLIFLGGISLRAPQYLVIALIPLYIYVTVEFIPWVTSKNKHKYVYLILIIILALNALTWYLRFIRHKDNALLETYKYMNSQADAQDIVLTEESIGVGIKQPYYKLDTHNNAEEIAKIKPTYIIIYLSSTQRPPKTEALNELLLNSQQVKDIYGFKEHIVIYKSAK